MLSHLEVNNTTYYFLVNIVRTLNRVYKQTLKLQTTDPIYKERGKELSWQE